MSLLVGTNSGRVGHGLANGNELMSAMTLMYCDECQITWQTASRPYGTRAHSGDGKWERRVARYDTYQINLKKKLTDYISRQFVCASREVMHCLRRWVLLPQVVPQVIWAGRENITGVIVLLLLLLNWHWTDGRIDDGHLHGTRAVRRVLRIGVGTGTLLLVVAAVWTRVVSVHWTCSVGHVGCRIVAMLTS